MPEAAVFRSGKGHRDENFPVASRLIRARFRAPILAFYDFVRTADDIADHPTLAPEQKLAHLDRLEASLLGESDQERAGVALRDILRERSLLPDHARDLLRAFRLDVTKLRYSDWDDLIDYCRFSAMPVGRFVLDVHGESQGTWAASDPLCAALQVINHLQDCREDYRQLDRVYVPLDALVAAGARVEELGGARASAPLRACLAGLAVRTGTLLQASAPLAAQVRDTLLGMEIAVIQSIAERLVQVLRERDPLSERVHLSRAEYARHSVVAALGTLLRRGARRAGRPATPGA